jgi:hypothetical protein
MEKRKPARRLDAQMRASLVAVAITGAVLALGMLAIFGVYAGFSTAVGAALAVGNLWALARIVQALLPDGESEGAAPGGSGAGWAILGVVKMFGLFAVVWFLMHQGVVSALPMLVGFGALPIGIAIGSLVRHTGDRQDPGP